MEMSDFTWQQQKYARPEIYVVTDVTHRIGNINKLLKFNDIQNNIMFNDGLRKIYIVCFRIFSQYP